MDLLFKRYASPYSFMNGMIRTGRFFEFVTSLWHQSHREANEEKSWQFYLHRVMEGSFNDFMEGLKNDAREQNLSEETIETTINHTNEILKNFNPEKGGEST